MSEKRPPSEDPWFEDAPGGGDGGTPPSEPGVEPADPDAGAVESQGAAPEPEAVEPQAPAPGRRRLPRPSFPSPSLPRRRPSLPAVGGADRVGRRRLVALGAVVALALVGGGVLAFAGGDGDPAPIEEAGSRFGAGAEEGAGGTLLDVLAPVLGTQPRPAPEQRRDPEPEPPTADALGRAPADAVAGLFLVGFRGTQPSASFFRRLSVRPYGGVLVTGGNYQSAAQMTALTGEAQVVARDAGHPAPLVAVEQEGGEVNELPGAPRSQADLETAGAATVRNEAAAAARLLRSLGIGMNLAPSADLAVAGGPAQGRAFSDDPDVVAESVRAAVAGYRRFDVASVVRHFPGHGAAARDPDAGPAPVGLSLEQLRASDMKPFEEAAEGGSAAPAMQMSNAIYVAYDAVTPATLVPDAVSELRSRIGFDGLILSGDLVAATATTGGTVGEAAVEALKAGVDMLLVPGGRAQQDEAYRAVVSAVRRGEVPPDRVVQALRRIASLRRATRETRQVQPQAQIGVPGGVGAPGGPAVP